MNASRIPIIVNTKRGVVLTNRPRGPVQNRFAARPPSGRRGWRTRGDQRSTDDSACESRDITTLRGGDVADSGRDPRGVSTSWRLRDRRCYTPRGSRPGGVPPVRDVAPHDSGSPPECRRSGTTRPPNRTVDKTCHHHGVTACQRPRHRVRCVGRRSDHGREMSIRKRRWLTSIQEPTSGIRRVEESSYSESFLHTVARTADRSSANSGIESRSL